MKCENFCFFLKKGFKSFGVSDFCCTFASAFASKLGCGHDKKEFFDTIYINR